MTCQEILIGWLNNAHALEQSIIEVLEKHADDASEMPEMQEKLRAHIEQTKSQADRVKGEIERLGGEVSGVKTWLADLMGKMQGSASDLAKDKIVKNAIAEHATEHLEMATYQSIMVAAEECGEEETSRIAKEIMEEETKMGEELKKDLPMIVRQYIAMQTQERNE